MHTLVHLRELLSLKIGKSYKEVSDKKKIHVQIKKRPSFCSHEAIWKEANKLQQQRKQQQKSNQEKKISLGK